MYTNFVKIEFGFGVGQDKEGLAISRSEADAALKKIKQEAARRFTAYTMYPVFGGWVNGDGRLVEEDGWTLFTIQEGDTPFTTGEICEQFAEFIKSSLNQEAVAITTTPVYFQLI